MDDALSQLRQILLKQDAKAQRLRDQLSTALAERNDTDTAIRVLEKLSGLAAPAAPVQPNENGALILKFVGHGESEALAPKDIVDRLSAAGHELNADLVRTQLWRMAKRGALESENGKYWRPQIADPFSEYAETVKQADERNPFAIDDNLDEPFGSASNRLPSAFDSDLDDDAPF